MNVWDFFTDPVLRAPTLGSMLMCLSASLVGVLVFVRRQSLLGEAISHCAYPGVVASVLISGALFAALEEGMAFGILLGAFCTGLIGLVVIDLLQRRLKVQGDAALCFTLSIFFGIGVLIASYIQFVHALWAQQIQMFLYGQAATMCDIHVYLYASLAALTIAVLLLFYREIQVSSFDRSFAESIGTRVRFIDGLLFFLLILAVVIGIRSVGVVLMAGMLIAPAVAARQYTHCLKWMLTISALVGALSGLFGTLLSVYLPLWGHGGFVLPTGPTILLTALAICFFSLLCAPERGLFSRFVRVARFRDRCALENALKAFWRLGKGAELPLQEIASRVVYPKILTQWLLRRLKRRGWIQKRDSLYSLTPMGEERSSRIVRLHRLWEAYLVFLGQKVEKVHRSAEEMEHIITPELEEELTDLLGDPTQDPHAQPIPRGGRCS